MKRLLLSALVLGAAASVAHAAPAVVAAELIPNYNTGFTGAAWTSMPPLDDADDLAGLIGAPTFPGGNSHPWWAGSASDQTWAGMTLNSVDGGATGYQKLTSGNLHGEWMVQWLAAPRNVAPNDSTTPITEAQPGASIYYDLEQSSVPGPYDLYDITIFGFGGFDSVRALFMMSVDVYVTTDTPVADFNGNWTLLLQEAVPNADPYAADRTEADGDLVYGEDITTVINGAGVPGASLMGMYIADDVSPGVVPIANDITGIRLDFYAFAFGADPVDPLLNRIFTSRTTPGTRDMTFLTEINANFLEPASQRDWNLY